MCFRRARRARREMQQRNLHRVQLMARDVSGHCVYVCVCVCVCVYEQMARDVSGQCVYVCVCVYEQMARDVSSQCPSMFAAPVLKSQCPTILLYQRSLQKILSRICACVRVASGGGDYNEVQKFSKVSAYCICCAKVIRRILAHSMFEL